MHEKGHNKVKLTREEMDLALDLMKDHPEQADSELTLGRTLERLVIAGTPERVADQILALRRDLGGFGTLLYTGHDWADPELSRRSLELMANEVWPRVLDGIKP